MRRWFALPAMLACGCALISGLSDIGVSDDAGTMDSGVALDGAALDVVTPSDATSTDTGMQPMDAGHGSALQLKTTCAYNLQNAGQLSFTGAPFTVSFWYRPDPPSGVPGQEVHPIVWHGGRTTAEPGWLIGIQTATLVFCAANGNVASCAASGPLNAVNHLLHIVGMSTPGFNRTLQLWMLDATLNQTAHTMIGQTTTAPSTWSSTAPLTLGGVPSGNNCVLNVQGVIDDLRIWSIALTQQQFDSNYNQLLSCSETNLVSQLKFDEGMGATTSDCAGGNKTQLNIGGTYAWLSSPFP